VASVPSLGRRSTGELTQIGVEFCDLDADRRAALESYIASYLDEAPQVPRAMDSGPTAF
jgi:hypothetical protein